MERVATVVSIVEGVLQTGNLDPANSFYDLGGTSFQAMRICVQIKQRLAVDISPDALFDADSIADFAAEVTGRTDA